MGFSFQLAGVLCDGKLEAKPHDGKLEALPHDGKLEALPHDGKLEALPHDGKLEALPHDGKLEAYPTMKQIIAIVKPFLAEKVLDVLQPALPEALSVREVKGFGRQKSYLDQYSETEFDQAFLPKVEITFWVDDDRYEAIIDDVVAVARTGRIGDGKIMVLSAEARDAKL